MKQTQTEVKNMKQQNRKVIETSEKCPRCEDPMENREIDYYCNECQISVMKPRFNPNIKKIMNIRVQIRSIAKEYGSNSSERYELMTAYDHLLVAMEVIKSAEK